MPDSKHPARRRTKRSRLERWPRKDQGPDLADDCDSTIVATQASEQHKSNGNVDVEAAGARRDQEPPEARPPQNWFEFITGLVAVGTESEAKLKRLPKLGRHVRRSATRIALLFVVCFLLFGAGIGAAVWFAGVNVGTAALLGVLGSALLSVLSARQALVCPDRTEAPPDDRCSTRRDCHQPRPRPAPPLSVLVMRSTDWIISGP